MTETELSRPDVFAYVDYRVYLRDYYAFGKEKRHLSHRGWARRAGIKSPTFLKGVMDGDRNLSDETALRVADACGLKENEASYFVALVRFNQAKSSDERRAAYDRVKQFARYRKLHALDVARDAYHSKWYLPAIRELAASPAFNEDPKWIARALRPRIKASEAKQALATLRTLGMLSRDERGRLRQTEALVTTGAETQNVHMVTYHKAMLARASESIDAFRREERDISSVTLCVDARGLERLKDRIKVIRRQLLEEEEQLNEGAPAQVVQLNFQLFPLSAKIVDPSAKIVEPSE